MAGGGIKGGVVHGETDEFSYNIVSDPVHVRDFQATILHLFGIDHERFTYKYQGLDMRLTGVEKARCGEGAAGVAADSWVSGNPRSGSYATQQGSEKVRTGDLFR